MKALHILLICMLVPLAGLAQNRTYKDGPHVGFAFGGDTRDPNMALGYQASMSLSDRYSLEAALSWFQDELVPDQQPGGGIKEYIYDTDIYSVTLSARAEFELADGFDVYGLIGGGYYAMQPDASSVNDRLGQERAANPSIHAVDMQLDINKAFGMHLGAGMQYDLSETWELFADFRFSFVKGNSVLRVTDEFPPAHPGLAPVRREHEEEADMSYDYGIIRVGVNYVF